LEFHIRLWQRIVFRSNFIFDQYNRFDGIERQSFNRDISRYRWILAANQVEQLPRKGSSRRIARKESLSIKRIPSDPKCNLHWSTDYVIRQQTAQNGVPADRVSIPHTHTRTRALTRAYPIRRYTYVQVDSPISISSSIIAQVCVLALVMDTIAFQVTLTLVAEVFIESDLEYKWGKG